MTNNGTGNTTGRNIGLVALATILILLVPFTAMRFTGDVAWGAADFVVAGVLLFGTGLAFVLISKKARGAKQRAAIAAVLLALLLLVWAELAVGIFD